MSDDLRASQLWPADNPAVVAHMNLIQGIINRLARQQCLLQNVVPNLGQCARQFGWSNARSRDSHLRACARGDLWFHRHDVPRAREGVPGPPHAHCRAQCVMVPTS